MRCSSCKVAKTGPQTAVLCETWRQEQGPAPGPPPPDVLFVVPLENRRA